MPRVVLYQPQIPPNTGNVARSCAATAQELHLVGPLGFEISDRQLRRAGLDYWPFVPLHQHPDWITFLSAERVDDAIARSEAMLDAASDLDVTYANNQNLNPGNNPVSRMTIASLADLGYQVTLDTADSYSLPGGATSLRAASVDLPGTVLRPTPAPA